jgi:glutamate carboxypeptidase
MTLPALVLPVSARALLSGARRKQPDLLHFTESLVRAESPSTDKAAVDACMAIAAEKAKKLGGRVKIHRQRGCGNLLEAHFGPRRKEAKDRVLLLGHLDTVWPVGTLAQMPYKLSEGKLTGPGVLDMKAGVAMAFTAIELLIEARLLDREIVLLLNSEEELGSPVSRPVTEALARDCSAVYVLEAALGEAVKTARKGTGNWRIDLYGIAAHAGVDYEKGVSALGELARIIETVNGWTEPKRGLTVSVGLAGGGSKTNVIPAHAFAEVDVRIQKRADGERIAKKFAKLRTRDPRCTLVVAGGINRPPMERKAGVVRLYRRARALAAELGFPLEEAATGGASDGNFTAALGIPTLDGLGPVGAGAHAAHEHLLVEHLAPRTALLAALLAR